MLYYCKPLLGKELRQSAKYPDALVKSILQGVRVEAQRRFPQRFLKGNEVYVAEPVEDPAAWAEVLRLAQRALVSDSTRGYTTSQMTTRSTISSTSSSRGTLFECRSADAPSNVDFPETSATPTVEQSCSISPLEDRFGGEESS